MRNIFHILGKKFRSRDFKIFLLFLLLSVLMWSAEKLRQQYRVNIPFEIESVNVPESYVVPGREVDKVNVTIEGSGFSILLSSFRSNTVTVPVSGLGRLQIGGETWAVFLPRRKHDFQEVMPEGIRFVEVSTDTILIPLLKVRQKLLPVRVRQEVMLSPQHQMSSPVVVSPDSILVKGTNNVMDTLSCIYTEDLEPLLISDTTKFEARLVMPSNTLSNDKVVSVTYNVEPYTEKNLSVGIRCINVPRNYEATLFPPAVRMTFRVGLSRFEEAEKVMFDVVADFKGIHPGDGKTQVKLSVESSPSFVSHIVSYPVAAEFLLQKRR